ncbi:50S ribosomal protein L11 methyltransferase [Aquibacillus albus]|uniref:Ribosomal protein L11 methyltransferase n=1 Tax=Aquibacillus albus TaxID=1168171 RepID=A0ABS2N528_9BACI|nr:50S ribosomal protein L11 methyltransferase [Aquibacillus albus]MBM7573213.1 ribosomal protein L11 methyltransferase [Aquibacillus albus]
MLHEFVVHLPLDKVDVAMEQLNIAGFHQFSYEPSIRVFKTANGYSYEELQTDCAVISIYMEESLTNKSIEAYFEKIRQVLNVSQKDIQHNQLDDNTWDQTIFEDIDLGNGWVLCYSGKESDFPNKNILKFEPQVSFGTGLHETTQDCLRLLLNNSYEGKTVLDLGTGSGLLSIGASLKGAKKVVAVDLEPVEREIQHNAELNNLDTAIEIEQADLIAGDFQITSMFDWIFINIGADETIKIIEKHRLLEKSNHFLISGVVEWNVDKVIHTFTNEGFSIQDQLQTNEWVTLLFSR